MEAVLRFRDHLATYLSLLVTPVPLRLDKPYGPRTDAVMTVHTSSTQHQQKQQISQAAAPAQAADGLRSDGSDGALTNWDVIECHGTGVWMFLDPKASVG